MKLQASFLTALCVFSLSFTCSAMHIIGGELTYEYLSEPQPGVKRFRFTMTLYRDCNSGGAQFDEPAEMAVYRGAGPTSTLVQTFAVNNPVTSTISSAPAPMLCLQRGVYTFTRDLPVVNDASYFIVYQRCCRAVSVTNVTNAGEVGFTIYAEISAAAQAGNNLSPVFAVPAGMPLCLNTPFVRTDFAATDADGDSLAYEFCSPVVGGGPLLQPQSLLESCEGAKPTPPCAPPYAGVPFTEPVFSAGNPFGSNNSVTINALTGALEGTVNTGGLYVFAVCVREFRDGVPIGTTRREYALGAIDCMSGSNEAVAVAPLEAHPNPVADLLIVRIPEGAGGALRAFTLDGRLQWQRPVPVMPGEQTVRIDVHGWPAGTYWLRLESAGQNRLARVVVRTD